MSIVKLSQNLSGIKLSQKITSKLTSVPLAYHVHFELFRSAAFVYGRDVKLNVDFFDHRKSV